MLRFLCSLSNTAWAAFVSRWIFGVLTLIRGWAKVFSIGPEAHAQNFFIDRYSEFWFLPEPLLWAGGLSIPFIELLAGILLILGWRSREAMIAMGLLLIVTTFGHALLEPFYDIGAGQTLGYLVLVLFWLMLPRGTDVLGIDGWLKRRSRSS